MKAKIALLFVMTAVAALFGAGVADARPEDCYKCFRDWEDCVNPKWRAYDWCLGRARQRYVQCKRDNRPEAECEKEESDYITGVCDPQLESGLALCDAVRQGCIDWYCTGM